MKLLKPFYCMALTAMTIFGLSSCSNELTLDEPMREGEVDFSVTTALPQEIQTYANDYVSSAEGGLKNLAASGNEYKIRFIMEVYPKGASETAKPLIRQIKYNDIADTQDARKTSFNVRLLAAQYDFVFWADIVKSCKAFNYTGDAFEGLKDDCYGNRYFLTNTDPDSDVLCRPIEQGLGASGYVEGDLRTIKASKMAVSFQHDSPEMYDGYAAHKAIDLRIDPPADEIVLKRPFAKLRLVTTDIDLLKDKNPAWNKTIITIEEDNLPNAYNALTGQTSTITELNNASKFWTSTQQATNSGIYTNEPSESSAVETIKSTGKTLYVFYLPVSNEAQNLKFNIEARDAKGNVLAETQGLSVSPVPLYSNKLTTIKGNLLSKNPTFNIRIDDEFEPEETVIENKEVSTIEDLKSALTGKDQRVTFTNKVTKAEGFELDFTKVARTTPVYAEGNNATLFLTLSNVEEGAVITVKGGANSPKNLQLNTNTKCSVRMDFPATTTVALNGESFKYLVYNCPTKRIITPSVDALFYVNNDIAAIFFPTNVNTSHAIALTSSYGLDTTGCAFESIHTDGNCNFMSTIQTWLNSNSGKTVWDFVGNANN